MITDKAPFELVYGKYCRLPINMQIPIYEFLKQFTSDQESFQARIDKLMELNEVGRVAFEKMVIEQERLRGRLIKEQEM